MASTTVKVEGLKDVEKALSELPKATGKNVLRRVLKARAQPVADAMQAGAPTNTRRLKDAIVVSTKQPKNHDAGKAAFASAMRAGASRADAVAALRSARASNPNAFAEAFVGPSTGAFYSQFQEFGTEHHGPQPFARPAWDTTKTGVLEGIKDDLWAEINKASKRLAKKAARMAAKG
jgi:HK97 gp10 family phage protein